MMRVKHNGFTIALVVICAALLASVVVACINGIAPFLVFGFSASDVILMRLVDMTSIFCFAGAFCLFVCHRMGEFRASQGTIFSLSALLFVLRHGIVALRAEANYIHASVTHAFCVCAFGALKSLSAHDARFTNAASVRIFSGGTGPARFVIRIPELAYLRRGLSTLWTWRKVCGVASRTDSIISRVIVAYDVFSRRSIYF